MFAPFLAFQFFCFGLVVSNFGAIAMDPLGHMAGTASSVQGFHDHDRRGALRFLDRPAFQRHGDPADAWAFAGFGIGGFLIVLIVEKGRLFQPDRKPAKRASAEFGH